MYVDETPNEYRVRIQDPSLFYPKTLRTKVLRKGIKLIIGKYKGQPITSSTHVQAIHFDKSAWTKYTATLWAEKYKEQHKRKSVHHSDGRIFGIF